MISWVKRKWKLLTTAVVVLIAYAFCLPDTLFHDPYSTVLESRDGRLLSASIAADGQWRFPQQDSIPERYVEALLAFEDKRFYYHPGVDPIAMGRAFLSNLREGGIVSGGSTITMQVIRLSRKEKKRSYFEKLIEMVLATRLELRHSKSEILNLYAAHAPFGGNVVGIQAACWRYFGRSEKELSWAEAALLAVLPNSPALIHPGRNRESLRTKRNLLLDKLLSKGTIDSLTCELAKGESVPDTPLPVPQYARHLLLDLSKQGVQKKITSTINYEQQLRVEEIVEVHHRRLTGNQIHNAAVLVAEVNTGNVVAYVGNVARGGEGSDVDVIRAPRSTGSILKPFLYAALLDEGKILPGTLLPDVPMFINGYTPKNFSNDYDGAVPADKALVRSLNIPAVHMLREFRYERFHAMLKHMGMTTLHRPPDHYGLSLILGGAEGTLWDITGMYASLARTLNRVPWRDVSNDSLLSDYRALRYTNKPETAYRRSGTAISPASAYLAFDALKELHRPGEETGWRYFESARKIAWKTGTSFGFRDGWAIGVTPDYVVGVWVGNADGEGRPGLTGVDAAAPLMFEVFAGLDGNAWFTAPRAQLARVSVCRKSGHRSSERCTDTEQRWVPHIGLETLPCPYHQRIFLSVDGNYQVNSACAAPREMKSEDWFILPPVQEYYYKRKNLSYRTAPSFRPGCPISVNLARMELIYPKPDARVFIPRDMSGRPGNVIFQLAHQNNDVTVFWHIDGEWVGNTRKSHVLAVNPPSGKHRLMLIDEHGAVLEQDFEVLPNL